MNGIEKAVEAAGGIGELALMVGISRQAVHKWVRRGLTPPERCAQVEKLTRVPSHQLNPRVFPAPLRKAA